MVDVYDKLGHRGVITPRVQERREGVARSDATVAHLLHMSSRRPADSSRARAEDGLLGEQRD